MYDIYGRNGEKIMLLDELKIEQDDLKVGDVVYTSHHPNIGVWVSFRYSKIRILIQQLWQELALNQYDNYGNDEFPHFVRMITPLFEETTVNIRDGLLPTYEQLFRWAHFTRRPEDYNLNISVVSMYDNAF